MNLIFIRHILFSLFLILSLKSYGEDMMTGIFNDKIKSLQISHVDLPESYPVIMLGTQDQLRISFDHLSEEREYLRYELVHCNANWQPSGLVDAEFLDGFNLGNIDNYDFSRSTTMHYVHYWLDMPNEEVAPKISGNYLLKVYPESDPDDVWFQCRFMASEQTAQIHPYVSSRTDIDYNKEHQQLNIIVDSERSNVSDAFNDITIFVQQNGRYDNEVKLQQPLRMKSRNISVYEHLAPLIFESGNEYRRFETISTQFTPMGVESIDYAYPYYHFSLYTDESRNDDMYVYDQTQHGRFKIREYNSFDSDVEADYVVVHFSLDYPEMRDAMIFIDGDFTNRRFNPEALMVFNRSTNRYERNMLLKQGAYNYQYLVVPNGKNRGDTGFIEGNKYQTVNEYLIKVYARSISDRYDRLIGVTSLLSE